MVLWFAGLSFLAVWLVFRDPAIDHRLVMAGALLPDVVDAASGGRWVAHSVTGAAILLAGVMLATRGRRLLRRRTLAVPIGVFFHLVLDAAWVDRDAFWWPFLGGIGSDPLPVAARPLVVNLLLELAGAAALLWAWRRFRLDEPDRRRHFVRSGRLSRDLVDP